MRAPRPAWRLLIGALAVGLIALAHVGASAWLPPYYVKVLLLIGVNIILAVSLNLINGFAGQFSLGHAGFMAVGAYLSAAMTFYCGPAVTPALTGIGLPLALAGAVLFVGALALGGAAAALAGLLVGLPTLRLRGDYLAIATLGFGEIIRVVILHLDVVGGARGFTGIPPLSNFFWVYLFVATTVLFARNFVNSMHGRGLTAIREDEAAAAAVGIDTTRYKVLAFVVGAFFGGVAGGLFAHDQTYINTDTFKFMKSVEVVVMVVLGGMGSITGSIAAAAGLTILPEALRAFRELRMVIYAALLIALMLARPQGLLGARELSWSQVRRFWRRARERLHRGAA